MANKLTKSLLSSIPSRGRAQEETLNTRRASNAGHSTAMSEDQKFRAKNALDDMIRAEGHKRDKALMRDVSKMAAEHKASIDSALSGTVKRSK